MVRLNEHRYVNTVFVHICRPYTSVPSSFSLSAVSAHGYFTQRCIYLFLPLPRGMFRVWVDSFRSRIPLRRRWGSPPSVTYGLHESLWHKCTSSILQIFGWNWRQSGHNLRQVLTDTILRVSKSLGWPRFEVSPCSQPTLDGVKSITVSASGGTVVVMVVCGCLPAWISAESVQL